MPTPRRVNCKNCGRHIDEVGPLSRRYLCESCSEQRAADAARQVLLGEGEYFERYTNGLEAAAARARARLSNHS